jgi:hypothetical protein
MGVEVPASTKAMLLRRRSESAGTWLVVSGPSMGRALRTGDRVRIDVHDVPRRGEIWAYVDDGGALVVHRFRSRFGDRHWFVGDGNRRDDRPVSGSRVVGRVVEMERSGRRRRVGRTSRVVGRLRLDVSSASRRVRRRGSG